MDERTSLLNVFIRRVVMVLVVLSTSLFLRPISCAYIPINIVFERMEEVHVADKQRKYDMAYEAMVDTLKWHEGYRAYPYYCMANVRTVGYGHAIKRGDSFDYPMTREQADSLLRVDFDKCISYLERTTDLEHVQKLAIAHFVYALGSGRYSNSTLRKLVESDQPIDNEIIKWINIRTKNGIVRSDYLKKSRIMELNLYNSQT